MRKHERERVDKAKYTDGTVCRDRDMRTYMKKKWTRYMTDENQ